MKRANASILGIQRFLKATCLVSCATLAITSCKPTFEELCADRIHTYEKELVDAQGAIEKLGTVHVAHRSPASLSNSDEKKENWAGEFAWERWAQKRLEETQDFSETLRDRMGSKEVRSDLSHIADQWVAFHGLVQVGDTRRMKRTLAHIQDRTRQVKQKTCSKPQ